MIKKLLIQNYALIEALELEFPSGLTIITGETGAGKSILLGALGLIMGNRADSRSLFDENKKCVVEAYFSIEKYGLASFFENNEIDYEDDLIIRRELTPAGKSRSFINDTPVNLKFNKPEILLNSKRQSKPFNQIIQHSKRPINYLSKYLVKELTKHIQEYS